jgi:hypothetical protein
MAESMGISETATEFLVGILFVILLSIGLGILFGSGLAAIAGAIVGLAFSIMLGLIPLWVTILISVVTIAVIIIAARTTSGGGE